mgnify:CR=1 FL=1
MKAGKVIGSLLIGAATVAAAYYGFYYKLEDGLTAWQHLVGKMTREEADEILGGTPKSYGDDYVIAWATAKKGGKESFEVKGIKYSAKTGKKI